MGKKVNKALHPTDAHRKEERKKEIKRNKFQKSQVRAAIGAHDAAQLPARRKRRGGERILSGPPSCGGGDVAWAGMPCVLQARATRSGRPVSI